jgi:hypothetical protein
MVMKAGDSASTEGESGLTVAAESRSEILFFDLA